MFIALLVYVDYILVTGNAPDVTKHLTTDLNAHFALKTLEELYYFMGIEVSRFVLGMFLSQTKYIVDLLSKVKPYSSHAAPV